jgi:hypothetical protein
MMVWLGTDLMYGGVDVLNHDGAIRDSWEDEVESQEDLVELMIAARVPPEDAHAIAHGLLEERKRWADAQAGKRWWRWGKT